MLDRHRDFALRHELEPQWTIPSDFEKWSDGSPMFAVKVSISSTPRLAGTAKRTAVHCGRTVSWLQGPSGMPRGCLEALMGCIIGGYNVVYGELADCHAIV